MFVPKTATILIEVVQKVKNIANGASLMTGAEVHIDNYELSYDDMIDQPNVIPVIYKESVNDRCQGSKKVERSMVPLIWGM